MKFTKRDVQEVRRAARILVEHLAGTIQRGRSTYYLPIQDILCVYNVGEQIRTHHFYVCVSLFNGSNYKYRYHVEVRYGRRSQDMDFSTDAIPDVSDKDIVKLLGEL